MIIVKNRELLIPNNERYIGTTYDNDTENRVFQVPRFSQRGVDLANLTFRLDIQYANESYDTVVLDKEVGEAFVILIWRITSATLQVPGTMYIGLRAIDDEATVKWSSFSAAMYAERHLNTPGNYGGSLTEIEQIEQDHQYMKGVVDELKANIDYAHDAEAWAKGTRSGSTVPSTDPTYHNNSKYYSEQASTKATAAANSATAAANSATQAAATVADTNTRFNNAVTAVTSDTEVIDARVGADGTTYPVLKTRLDTEHTQLKSQLQETVYPYIGHWTQGTPTYTLVSPAYIDNDGSIKTNNESMSMTSYIPVSPGNEVKFKRTGYEFYAWSAFFDATHVLVGSTFTVDATEQTKCAPEGASFVAFSGMTSRISTLVVTLKQWTDGLLITGKQDKYIGTGYGGNILVVGEDGNITAKKISLGQENIANMVSMMPDFFWVSRNEISAFSASLSKYKEGTVQAENNAWFQITGNAGDDYVTIVTGGNGDIADITAAERTSPFGCVIMYDDGKYYPCNAQYLSDTTFTVYPKLKDNITAGELAQIRTGIHLSRRGYRAYAQHLYDVEPKYTEKNKYIARWRVGDNIPWSVFGDSYLVHTVLAANQNTAFVDKINLQSYAIGFSPSWTDHFNNIPGGIEWDVNINDAEGYVEYFIGLSTPSGSTYETVNADAFICELWIDGVLKHSYTKTKKICERICMDFDKGSTAKLKIYCNRWQVAGHYAYINRVTWWVNEKYTATGKKLIPDGTVVGQLYDSWGEFDDAESAVYLQKEINADAGSVVPYFNGSLSNQTSAWGKAWFYNKMWQNHPSLILTDFGINDKISAPGDSVLPSTIVGPNGETYDNVISQADYIANMGAIKKYALNNNIIPVFVGVALPGITYQEYPNAFVDAESKVAE